VLQFANLAILTKKELMALLIDEKRTSYRKGYKAGAAMKYRHQEKKPEVFVDEFTSITDKQMAILKSKFPIQFYSNGCPIPPPPPEVSAQVTDENGMPTVYGDSLPVKPMPEVVVHTEEPIQGC
jgi:hypothetical protein